MAGINVRKYAQVSNSKYTDIKKMRDLTVGKEYFIKKVEKSKFAHICTTANTESDFENKKISSSQIKDEKNNITFYANKPLSDYVTKNNIIQFYLRITDIEKYKKDGNEYLVPQFEISIVKQERELTSDDEYDELVQ